MRALVVLLVGCWSGVATPPPASTPAPTKSRPPAPIVPLAPQLAESLITIDRLVAITGFTDPLEIEQAAAPNPASYDEVHFRAINKPERFDFMLRVWTVGPAEATKKLEELAADLPNVKPLPGLAARAITADEGISGGSILGVAFLDRRGAVVLLTCGDGQCTRDQLVVIAHDIAGRIR
jgi:hypothetical protein